ncbi:MAG: hypothetical protein VCC04_11130, partial [Myxococcota bacterium]
MRPSDLKAAINDGSDRGMNGICYIASLKYSPIMWTLGRGVGKPVRSSGQPVRYLLASGYGWLTEDSSLDVDLVPLPEGSNPFVALFPFLRAGIPKQLRELFQNHPPSVLVFMNLNPLVDRIVIALARRANPGVRIVTFLHEPHTIEKLIYGW